MHYVFINHLLIYPFLLVIANHRCRVDKKDYHWETQIFLPKMRIEGNYHMQGRILVIPLNGRGKCLFEPCEYSPNPN